MLPSPLQTSLLSGRKAHRSTHAEETQHPFIIGGERLEFHRERSLALMEPAKALETLQPYGYLDISVISASGLRGFDFFGKADPFVKVYIDDHLQQKSRVIPMTLQPRWDFHLTPLAIWSPRSVVLIKIMDYDVVGKDDLLGFVEFYVGDLEPNSEISGRFEIRDRSELYGTSNERLHRWSLLDEDTRIYGKQFEHVQGKLDAILEQRQAKARLHAQNHSTPVVSEVTPEVPTIATKPERPRSSKCSLSLCHGKPPKETEYHRAPEEQTSEEASEPIAATSCSVRPAEPSTAPKSSGSLQMSIKFTAASEKDDEWYASCFPRPHPKSYSVPMDELPVLDLGQIYQDLLGIKTLLWQKLLRWLLLLVLHVISWKSKVLSFAVLCWWWLVSIKQLLFLPSLPLVIAFFVLIVRSDYSSRIIFVDEENAALDDDGFKFVASFRDPKRTAGWLRRVICHVLSSKVTDEKAFVHFAFFVAKNGQPVGSMQSLLESLRKQEWLKRSGSEELGRPSKGEKLEAKFVQWHVPGIFVPDIVEQVVREYQVPLHNLHHEVRVFFCLAEDMIQDEEVVQKFYKVCLGVAIMLLLIQSLLFTRIVHQIFTISWTAFLLIVGTVVLTLSSRLAGMLRTAMRATMDHRFFLQRRASGGILESLSFIPDVAQNPTVASDFATSSWV